MSNKPVTSSDPRKPAVMAAIKHHYNCRKVTNVTDHGDGVFSGHVLNLNGKASPMECYEHGRVRIAADGATEALPGGKYATVELADRANAEQRERSLVAMEDFKARCAAEA